MWKMDALVEEMCNLRALWGENEDRIINTHASDG